MEFLLVNHPLDCPICDQGGECDLQVRTISLFVYLRVRLTGPLLKLEEVFVWSHVTSSTLFIYFYFDEDENSSAKLCAFMQNHFWWSGIRKYMEMSLGYSFSIAMGSLLISRELFLGGVLKSESELF